MCIYLGENIAKFHPDPIWNGAAIRFFWRGRLNQNKKNNKMNSDMRAVPDTKIGKFTKLQQAEFFIAEY